MQKVLIVKNITREGPGLLTDLLREYAVDYDLVDLYARDKFPSVSTYSAVFVFGGPDSANDQTPKMRTELQRIKEAVDAEIPYLGVCLGMQALVKANGGEVYKHKIREIGWRDPEGKYFEVNLTDEGRADPIFKGLVSPPKIFHLHSETVRLTPNMALLATAKYCRNQVLRVRRNAYGIQGHIELTPAMFEEWVTSDPDLASLGASSLREDYAEIRSEYERAGRQILTNFLKIANLIA